MIVDGSWVWIPQSQVWKPKRLYWQLDLSRVLSGARLVSFPFSITLSWNWYFQIFAHTCIKLNIDIPLIDRTADLSHNNDDILWHESTLIHFVGLCIWCYVGPVCAELGNLFCLLAPSGALIAIPTYYWYSTPLFQITPVLNTGLSLSEPLQLYKGYNAI